MTQAANLANAINNFVVGCKQDGIWDSIKACCIMAAWDGLEGALYPLKGPAPTNHNFVDGDYDRETGLKGDGSTKYLDSNRNSNADPQNNHHFSIYSTAPSNVTSGLMGSRSSANNTGTKQLNWITSAGAEFRACSATASLISVAANSGLYGASRGLSTSFQAKVPGSVLTQNVASDGLDSANFFIFSRNTGGVAFIHSDWRVAFYSIGESLDLAKLDTRVTALITAIGAAIS